MLKHNKKKNGRIIYEQLMQLATRLALTDHAKEAKHILGIVKEYYGPKTMLGKEKKLFDSILEFKTNDRIQAEAVLAETLSEISIIDREKIEKERVNLINCVMKNIGKDLFSIPIKEYKIIASTQILFNEIQNKFKYSEPKERIKIKNILIENISKVPEKEESYEIDNFTYNIMVKKFNEKYFPLMNESQKSILSDWLNFLLVENNQEFEKSLKLKIGKIKAELDLSMIKDEHKNSEYASMLQEARKELQNKKIELNEEFVHTIMRYCDLVDDLREICHEKTQIN